MSVTPPPPIDQHNQPVPPTGPRSHPMLVLGVAVALAGAAGLLAGEEAGVTVLITVLGLFTTYRSTTT
ncbi:hypothetical protein [Nocardia noduli]|uniref:hypothetical protein n=1 Tax=Nocardia noduli TaxID=2815722 RepID=UPI001C218C8F|nr:hypothetical protein [Nocardia noduli]